MKILFGATATILTVSLGACGSGGNLRSAAEYGAPSVSPLTHPSYNPYAAYGDERGHWRPEVVDRDGRLARPREPTTENNRAEYESAPWAIESIGALDSSPRGTF